jgi:hypothetical protein
MCGSPVSWPRSRPKQQASDLTPFGGTSAVEGKPDSDVGGGVPACLCQAGSVTSWMTVKVLDRESQPEVEPGETRD